MDLNEFKEALIKEVRSNPLLYDKNNQYYSSTSENLKFSYRGKTWESIAKKLNKSVDECKTCWKNLRDSYVRLGKANNWTNDIEKYDKWQHFKSLTFLREHVDSTPKIIMKRKRSKTEECLIKEIPKEKMFVIADDKDETATISQTNKKRKLENPSILTVKTKLYIIRLLVEGEDATDIAKNFNVTMKTITSIYENAENLRNNIEAKKILAAEDKKMQKMEELLATWVSDMNDKNLPISNNIIKDKAKSIYKDLEVNRNSDDDQIKFFKASDKWLEEWLKKHPKLHDTKFLDDITDIFLIPNSEEKLSTEIINIKDELTLNEEEISIPDDEMLDIDPLTDIREYQCQISNNQSKNEKNEDKQKEEQNIENEMKPEKKAVIINEDKINSDCKNNDSLKKKWTENRLKIIQLLDNGTKLSEISKTFDLPESLIQKILNEHSDSLRNFPAVKSNKEFNDNLSMPSDLIKTMEEQLLTWILEMSRKKSLINLAIIQKKAKSLLRDLANNSINPKDSTQTFFANLEWFNDFQKRSGLQLDKETNCWVKTSKALKEPLAVKKYITITEDDTEVAENGSLNHQIFQMSNTFKQPLPKKKDISLIKDEDFVDVINDCADDQMFVDKENEKTGRDKAEHSEDEMNPKHQSLTMNDGKIIQTYEIKNKSDLMQRLEELLSDWITDMFGKGLVVGSHHITYKAQSLFNKLKRSSNNPELRKEEFPKNDNWFKSLQERCDIHFDDEKNTWFQKNKYKTNTKNIPFFEDGISIINLPVDDIVNDSMNNGLQMSINVSNGKEKTKGRNLVSVSNIIDDKSQLFLNKEKIKEENVGAEENSVDQESLNSVHEEENGGDVEHNSANNIANQQGKVNRQMDNKCCISSCDLSKNTKNLKLYKFPRGGNSLSLWLLASKTIAADASKKRICEKHFERKWLGKKKLKSGAIPTLFLANGFVRSEIKYKSDLMLRFEELLSDWLTDMFDKGLIIRSNHIKCKAQTLFQELKQSSKNPEIREQEFPKNDNWFKSLKKRCDIYFDNEKYMWVQKNKYKTNIGNLPLFEDGISIINLPVDDIVNDSINNESEMSINLSNGKEETKEKNVDSLNYMIDDKSQLFLNKDKMKEENACSEENSMYDENLVYIDQEENGEDIGDNSGDEIYPEDQPIIISQENINLNSEKDISLQPKSNSLPLKTKLEIIEAFEKGTTLSYIAQQYKLSKSTLLQIYKNAYKVRNCLAGVITLSSEKYITDRSDLIQKMETELTDWIYNMIRTKSFINRNTIKSKAKIIFYDMKKNSTKPQDLKQTFVPDTAWFKPFLKRSGINESTTGVLSFDHCKIKLPEAKFNASDAEIVKNELLGKMEKSLLVWIHDMKRRKSSANKHTIKNKARSLLYNLQLNSNNPENSNIKFIASEAWFKGFVKRFGISDCIADDIPGVSKTIIRASQSDLIQRMETLLAAWIFDMNSNNLPMTLNIIEDKATSLYNDLKNTSNNYKNSTETFDASFLWFEGFKNRFCLQNLKLLDEVSNDNLNFENNGSFSTNESKEQPLSNKELMSLFQDESLIDTVSISSSSNEEDQNEMNMEVNENEEGEVNTVHEIHDVKPTTITSPVQTNTSNNSEENYYYYLKKKTRKRVSWKSKLNIIELLDKGLKKSLICEKLGLPMSTVRYVHHHVDKIRESIKAGTINITEPTTVVRPIILPKVEKLLKAWILDINKKHLNITARKTKTKALSLFNDLKKISNNSKETFNASYGWFTSFRQRSGIDITLSRKDVDVNVKEYSSNISSNLKPLSNEELISLYLEDKTVNNENNDDQSIITLEDDDGEEEIEELELEEEEGEGEDELELEEQLALDEEMEYELESQKLVEEEEDLILKEEDLKLKEEDLKLKEEEQENAKKTEYKEVEINSNNSATIPIQLDQNRVNFEEDFIRFLKASKVNNLRTFIPLKLKNKIIDLLEKNNTTTDIATQLKIEESVIITIKNDLNKFRNIDTERQFDLIPKMEKLLLAWISDINGKNLQLTSRMVQEKAKSLFNYLKEKSKNADDSKQVFTGGYNWLEGFKKRYNITIDNVNEVDLKKQLTNSISPIIKLNNIEKRSRSAITFKQKLDIIQLLDKGNKAAHIARELRLPETTVRTIYKNADKIRTSIAAGSKLSCEATTKIRSSLMQRMEKLLTAWIFDINSKNLPISSRIIQEKAKSLFNDLKENSSISEDAQQTFNASYGWFERFKKRSGLHSIKLLSEVGNIETDESSCTGALNLKDEPLSNEELILIYGDDVTFITDTDTVNSSSEENQIINLDDDNEENEQENLVIIDESSDEDSESNFPAEKLTEAMKDLDNAMYIFQKYDKNTNRSKSVRLSILESIECYRDLLLEKVKDNLKRNKVSYHNGEISQNNIEICNLPTE